MSTHIIANTTRSAPLGSSLPLHGSPPLIGRVFAIRSRLGCHQEVPCFISALLPHVPPPVRREEVWVLLSGSSLNPGPSPRVDRLGSSYIPDTGFCQARFTTLQRSLHAAARMVADPPVPARPGVSSPAAEDFYSRAFPSRGHPPLESGITTWHHQTDTMAELSPAGVLPLQAATTLTSCHSPSV